VPDHRHLIYPWWLWVAVPPGAVLGVIWWMVADTGGKKQGPALPE